MCRLKFVIFLALVYPIKAFNISPHPNLVINYPLNYNLNSSQSRSSYFGYSLVIRNTSIIVGAPRAKPTMDSQMEIDEPGAIYRCLLTSGACRPYILDARGNVNNYKSCLNNNMERKGFQWLGGSMDGGTRDTDKLIVCAPRFYAESDGNYHMSGVCYWVQNTAHEITRVTRISPLRIKTRQTIQADKDKGTMGSFVYIFGEMGLSAHVTDDNSRFVIGAPGINNWKGSVIFDYPEDNSTENHLTEENYTNSCHLEHNKTIVPELQNWNQGEDSYLGYAVSSGHFDSSNSSKLLYVATAPQANLQSGEAYIFSLDDNGKSINKLHLFNGTQFGEYFGYSILSEDLNGDGMTDVIISAPQYVLQDEDSYDNGAIYVFINKGSFHFEQTIIHSPVGSEGRFGTTLSPLGDINLDGYNDVAVGAPFAGNGSVLIYLGSEHGLQDPPSQRLDAPLHSPSHYGAHMFGHGLSRGSDIDSNGFNDFVIGAPNAEVSYLYKAYPVVKVIAKIKSEYREIKPNREKLNITACYRLDTKAKKMQQLDLDIRILIDTQLKRLKFSKGQTSEFRFRATAGLENSCQSFEIQVRYSEKDLSTPINLEMHYKLTKTVPDSEEFCEACAVVDPKDPKVSTQKLIFSTDCVSDICVADLHLRSKNVSPTYILGSADTLQVNYEITNSGETAYLPQFNVTSTSQLAFSQVPGNCKIAEAVMVCDLNSGLSLAKGDSDSVTVSFDVSQLSGQSLIIQAEVFSAGNEKNRTDNKETNVISLKEFADIDASGGQTNDQIVFKNEPYSAEIINHYEIKSHGPSIINELVVSLYIPVYYKAADSISVIPIIDISSLKMQAKYDSQTLPIQFYDQNNTTLSTIRKQRDVESLNGHQEQNSSISDLQTDELESLPIDNTIVLNCLVSKQTICVRAEFRLKFFPQTLINLSISFNVDLNQVEDSWEYFVIQTNLGLLKKGDPTSSSFKLNKKIKSNVIYKVNTLSIWKIVLSVISGVLLLAALTYTLYKSGFFKRAKKEELKQLIRKSIEE
ncbi:hypothetical protein KR084_007421, partial [Drosophila pseudotakahashii]